MRTILWTLATILIIGLSIIFVGPLLISTDVLRDQAFAKLEAVTGYRLRVSGPVQISLFPSLDLVAEDVGIAQTATGDKTEFATAKSLRLGLVLRALLSGKIQMTEVTLIDPVVRLPESTKVKDEMADPDGAGPEATNPLNKFNAHRLVIKNGTVLLPSPKGVPGKRIEALTLDASLLTKNGPLRFDLRAAYAGQPVRVAGSIGGFSHFLGGGPAPIRLAVEAPGYIQAKSTFIGTAIYRNDIFRLTRFTARSGEHRVTGKSAYKDDVFKLDLKTEYEGQPVLVAGSIDGFSKFIDGAAAPITIAIDAPAHLPAEARLAGTVILNDDALALTQFTVESGDHTLVGTASYKDDTLTLTQFSAESSEHVVTGEATYKDDVLTISHVSAKSGEQTVTGDATIKDDILSFDLHTVHEGQPVHIVGSIESFENFLDERPAATRLAIAAPAYLQAEAICEGTITYKEDVLALDQFTVRSGDYSITGNGTYKDNILTLNAITADISGQTLTGAVTASFAGDVPGIGASLNATTLDLNKLLSNSGDETSSGSSEAGAVASDIAGEGASGWSDAKIDFSPLKAINARLKLAVGELVYDNIKISSSMIDAALSGGKLTAESPSLNLYNGAGTAVLTIDASGEVPTHRIQFSLVQLDAYPFLSGAADFQSIEGKGTIGVDLTASGESQHAIVSTLSGTATFDFTDGAIRGLNVANMLRNLTTGILTGWQFSEGAKTDFTKLAATFKLADGEAHTEDLRLAGPLVSVGGTGTVDLTAQTLKFRVNPLMLASVEAAGGKNRLLGFPVPVAISGPWVKPLIYPDIVGILDHPVAAYEQLNKLGGGLIAVPASILGIDTGGRGLVETGVAIPGALAKGAIKGAGVILGRKQPDDAGPADIAAQEAPSVNADTVGATKDQQQSAVEGGVESEPAPAPALQAPVAENNELQVPAADGGVVETDSRPKSPPPPPVNPLMQGMFGN